MNLQPKELELAVEAEIKFWQQHKYPDQQIKKAFTQTRTCPAAVKIIRSKLSVKPQPHMQQVEASDTQ